MSAPATGALRGWTLVRSSLLSGVCSVASLLPGGAAPALTVPTNLIPPSISGSGTSGSTLTVTPGTWSGNPVPTVSREWLRDGLSTGQTGLSYNLTAADVGGTITVHETAVNSQGTVSVDSNAVGPVTGTGLGSLTVTNVSAPGASPLVMSVSSTSGTPSGVYFQWEFDDSETPAKNADGSYATPTQTGLTFVDGESWSRLDLALGYDTINGPFAFHMRALIDDDNGVITVTDELGQTSTYTATTDWSNDYADTIATTTTYRYLRLYVTAGNSGSGVLTVGEVEIADTVGGPDTTGGHTYTASDQETSLDAGAVANAYDDNTATFWETHISGGATPFPHWTMVDYGTDPANWIAPNELRLRARSNNGSQMLKDAVLQGSADAESFTDIITITGATAWANGEQRTYHP